MIYISADDYGLSHISSMHIQQCIDAGVLNKVSVFPNLELIDMQEILKNKEIKLALHLNFVEGRCMAEASEIPLIVDENGMFKHTFGGLLGRSVFYGKKFKKQIYKEIKAQVLFWKKNLPQGKALYIDSHQHTHMIPSIFRALLKVLEDENMELEYMRIPVEPLLPYMKTPSLYITYDVVNVIKQWVLRFLWIFNKKLSEKHGIQASYFMGILFSGKMDEKRVSKILPKYIKMAERDGRDIEVLFHPGYVDGVEEELKNRNIVFQEFYLSQNRKTEFESAMKLKERRVK